MEGLLIAMRFVQFGTVMVLFGSSLFPVYALPRGYADIQWRKALFHFLQRLAVWASALGLVSALLWLTCEAVLMSGDPQGYADRAILMTVLNNTVFGRVWRWRLGLLAVLTIYVSVTKRSTPQVVMMAGALLVATLAPIGHGAMGTGFDAWIHLGNQDVHMLAASVWVGGLAPLLYMTRLAQTGIVPCTSLYHSLKRFSAVGLAAVLAILSSGSLNTWYLVGSLDALFHTQYGQVLLVKISLFLAMIVLALLNRLFLMPCLVSGDDNFRTLRRLTGSIAVEQSLALLIVAAISLLGTMMPAFDMRGM